MGIRSHVLAVMVACAALLGSYRNASAADAALTPAQLAFFKQADDALTELEKYVAPGRAMQAEEEYEEALPLIQSASGPTPKGFALLRHAADLGDVGAQVQFAGLMAKYGRNNVSAHYSALAAARGNAESMHKLGRENYLGTRGPKDFALAFKYFNQCAALNYADCATYVGKLYETGLGGVDKDIEKAASFYIKSTPSKNFGVGARVRLAYIYLGSYPAIPRNPVNTAYSIGLLNSPNVSGTEEGDEYGTALLAWAYETLGLDGHVDPAKAKELKEMAVRQHQFRSSHPPREDNGTLPVQ